MWEPAVVDGIAHDLSHLDPFDLELSIPAKGDRPARHYAIHVSFSMHTFTRAPKAGERLDPARSYSSDRETRLFDLDRYNLSFRLRSIIEGLGSRKVFHTRHGTYVTVDVVGQDGRTAEYSVFFEVARADRRGRLRLYVRSAYVQDRIPRGRLQPRKPIKIGVIAHNVMAGRPIRPPE